MRWGCALHAARERVLEKIEKLTHAVSLHYMHNNFARRHQTLGCTPAQAAGVTDRRWKLTDRPPFQGKRVFAKRS
jgi:hypothetical protein